MPNNVCNTPFEINIVILGDVDVGKSSIVDQFTKESFNYLYLLTTTPKRSTKEIIVSEKKVTLQILDIGGQGFFENPIENIYEDANIIFFVFDATTEESFTKMKSFYEKIPGKSNAIKVLVGNKYDLTDQIAVTRQTAEEYARNTEHPFDFFINVSAKDNENIQILFTQAVEKHFEKNPAPKKHTKQEIKEMYYKNVSFFSIRYFLLFSCISKKNVDEIIANLKNRAFINGDGASAKTLTALGILRK